MSNSWQRRLSILLTCEHGGNTIPARYRNLFRDASARRALESHRGWDPGSLRLARCFRNALVAPLISSTTSRLLIELNRSLDHPQLFSEWSGLLDETEQQILIERCYSPYRDKIVAAITAAHTRREPVLHISLHTFTPFWNGQQRTTDIGLLFDPRRSNETALCIEWQRRLRRSMPQLKTHRNRPYRGTADGLTTALRSRYLPSRYLGIELEVNQRFFSDRRSLAAATLQKIVKCLQDVLSQT